MAQMGRIGGPLLADNLLRNGNNLAFDTNLLFFNVNSKTIGINMPGPSVALHVGNLSNNNAATSGALHTNDLKITTQLEVSNFNIVGNTITTDTGGMTISPDQTSNPTVIIPALGDGSLYLVGNVILNTVTNDNINFTANTTAVGAITNVVSVSNMSAIYGQTLPVVQTGGSGATIYFPVGPVGGTGVIVTAGIGYTTGPATITQYATVFNVNITSIADQGGINFSNDAGNVNVNVYGTLEATGNITFDGSIQLGDNPNVDTITFVAEVNSDIIPDGNGTRNLGSSSLKWNNTYSNITTISGSYTIPTINATTITGGNVAFSNNTIFNTNSSNTILIAPSGTGVVNLNGINRINGNNIYLPDTGSLTISTTGTGYSVMGGTYGVVIPSGSSSNYPLTPETGTLRYNAAVSNLEVFTGTAWIPSYGNNATLSSTDVRDLTLVYELLLGF